MAAIGPELRGGNGWSRNLNNTGSSSKPMQIPTRTGRLGLGRNRPPSRIPGAPDGGGGGGGGGDGGGGGPPGGPPGGGGGGAGPAGPGPPRQGQWLPSTVKLQMPRAFNGSGEPKARKWQVLMTRYLRTCGVHEAQWQSIMATNLYGAASDWLTMQELKIHRGERPPFRDWMDFMDGLATAFEFSSDRDEAWRDLHKLKQTGTVKQFVKEFQRLVLRIPDLEEDHQYLLFVDGLKSEVQKLVAATVPRDVEAAIISAERLEALGVGTQGQGGQTNQKKKGVWRGGRKKKGQNQGQQQQNPTPPAQAPPQAAAGVQQQQQQQQGRGGGRGGGGRGRGGGNRGRGQANQGRQNPQGGGGYNCYLCGKKGHPVRQCPRLEEVKNLPDVKKMLN
ncbi:hypothetical protein BSKO_02864 [Bryopsis sp. KO-2023]|nr:hypothetical protein BSKO_02864 [Bryopsis sp. KO-2023]